MFFNQNEIANKIQHYKIRFWEYLEHLADPHAKDVEEERLDHELQETFPASDAPSHRSKSVDDLNNYTPPLEEPMYSEDDVPPWKGSDIL